MPTNLSLALQEAYASAPTEEIIYHTLELSHSAIGSLYIVHGFDEITTTVPPATWVPVPFELSLPEVSSSGPPQLQIKIDNVSAQLARALDEAAESGEQVSVIYRAYLKSHIDEYAAGNRGSVEPQNNPPFVLSLSSIEVTPLTVTATASLKNYANRKWPRRVYRDDEFPGLVL